MVNFSDMPLSMANAFEKAVKAKDGFFPQLSLQAFNQYWDRVANGYGLNGAAAQFSLSDVDPITGQVQQMPTLEQLKSAFVIMARREHEILFDLATCWANASLGAADL